MSNPFAPPADDGTGRRRQAVGEPVDSNPRVLEYFPEEQRHHSSAIAWYVFISPLLVAIFIALIEPDWSIPGALVATVVLWYHLRRQRKRPGATFKVEDSHLVVLDAAGHDLVRVTLDDLEEVALDTKTIQRVQENVSAGGIPELRFVESQVGPGIDNSRIELVTANDVIPLTDYYTSSIDATDWFSKIRRFLRKNGWTPLDERGK
jgi:hypothetical protein